MSQEKVNKYKEEKKNRKAQMEKEKRRKKFWKIFGPVLAIIIVAALGAGIYFIPKLTDRAVTQQSAEEIDMDALMEMLNSSLSENDTTEITVGDAPVEDTSTAE
ncbi:MAG: hypothetical protein ACI4AA_00890 [Lachnospiraceae bacterium]